LGSYDTGMQVYFPGVVLTVDIPSDCHLSYESLGKSALLSSLHYVQPRCLTVVYPTERFPLPDSHQGAVTPGSPYRIVQSCGARGAYTILTGFRPQFHSSATTFRRIFADLCFSCPSPYADT
jgi:hypothetical protein